MAVIALVGDVVSAEMELVYFILYPSVYEIAI